MSLNRWVFKWRLKVRMFSHSRMSAGREFTCSTFYSFFDCLLWHCFVIYLGKASIEAFRQQHPWIKHSYSKIYTKVFNEQKTVRMRGQRRLQDVQDNLAA